MEEIAESPSGSVKDMNQKDSFLDPKELSDISIADLLNLVKGDAEKNKTEKLLRSIGFQTPIKLQQSSFIGSISYKSRSVNINGKKFQS